MRHDYIVIGSGAGGAAVAWRLAQTGRRVLVLEKGGKLPTDGSTLDVDRVLRQAAFTSKEVWRIRDGRAVALKEYFNIGGKTKWSGAALVRFQRHEFDADHDHRCRPWPIGYDDLESYYAEAEDLLSVRSVEVEPDLRRLLDGLRRCDAAWEEHPLPLGLAPRIADYDQEVRRFDGGFASPRGLKSDAEVCLLDRIKSMVHVAIAGDKEVVALAPADGDPRRIGAVVCADGSRYEAAIFVLAAGALHSPRLLQRYLRRNGDSIVSPSVGQIGRNYKKASQLGLAGHLATARDRPATQDGAAVSPGLPAQQRSDDRLDRWCGPRRPSAGSDPAERRKRHQRTGLRILAEHRRRLIAGEPRDRCRGCVFPTRDYNAARLPEARVEHQRLRRMLQAHLLRLGHVAPVRKSPIQSTAYACGTLVAGDDPNTSVVGPDGRVHAFENLYVADASVLPRSGRVNPALTIYAWALRVGDLLASRARGGQKQ